jgi:hypothetical protein
MIYEVKLLKVGAPPETIDKLSEDERIKLATEKKVCLIIKKIFYIK